MWKTQFLPEVARKIYPSWVVEKFYHFPHPKFLKKCFHSFPLHNPVDNVENFVISWS